MVRRMTARPGRWEPMAEAQRQRSKRRHVRRLLRRYDRRAEAAVATKRSDPVNADRSDYMAAT